MELLEFVQRAGAEPALHLGVEVAGVEAGEREPPGGARMLRDDRRDGGNGDGVGVCWVAGEFGAGVEVERHGVPQGPPSAREYLRAAGVLGGEEGDDGGEQVVGELADEIAVGIVAVSVATLCPLPCVSIGI
jgi:hypothetical protein